MKHIKEYALALPKYLQNVDNALDRFIKFGNVFAITPLKNQKYIMPFSLQIWIRTYQNILENIISYS